MKSYIVWAQLGYYQISNFSAQYESFPNRIHNDMKYQKICSELLDDIDIEGASPRDTLRQSSLITETISDFTKQTEMRTSEIQASVDVQTPKRGKIIYNNSYKSNEALFSGNKDRTEKTNRNNNESELSLNKIKENLVLAHNHLQQT